MFHGRSYILNYAVWGRLTPKCTNAVGARLTSECIYIVQSEQGWLKRASIYSLSVFTECSLSKRDLKNAPTQSEPGWFQGACISAVPLQFKQQNAFVHGNAGHACSVDCRLHLCNSNKIEAKVHLCIFWNWRHMQSGGGQYSPISRLIAWFNVDNSATHGSIIRFKWT